MNIKKLRACSICGETIDTDECPYYPKFKLWNVRV